VRGFGRMIYVTKPFPPASWQRACARYSGASGIKKPTRRPLSASRIWLSTNTSRRVTVKDEELNLTSTEYKMLSYICQNAGRVGNARTNCWTTVWGEEYQGAAHLLQVNIARCVKTLGDDAKQPEYIMTRSGIGYIHA